MFMISNFSPSNLLFNKLIVPPSKRFAWSWSLTQSGTKSESGGKGSRQIKLVPSHEEGRRSVRSHIKLLDI